MLFILVDIDINENFKYLLQIVQSGQIVSKLCSV